MSSDAGVIYAMVTILSPNCLFGDRIVLMLNDVTYRDDAWYVVLFHTNICDLICEKGPLGANYFLEL